MINPYIGLAPNQYWRSAMAYQAPGLMNPSKVHHKKILPSDKIATIGSCFAQHVSRALDNHGFQRFITETGAAWMSPEFARSQQFGLYSARYGNVYTPRQALQLLLRAFGEFKPQEPAWQFNNSSGHFADPFRPNVQLNGFKSIDELLADRATHLTAVRKMFESADWLILTLGLTEAWHSLADGAIFPMAPGVIAGSYDSASHAFINLSVTDCMTDLETLCHRVHEINPRMEIILTVSPVALAATYETQHVWYSTVYSKSALRVAAENCANQFGFVSYFPAYEIITSPLNANNYLKDDMREVNAAGVAHVMRCFFDTYTESILTPSSTPSLTDDMAVVCEESSLNAESDEIRISLSDSIVLRDFDEAAYLQANADVAAGIKAGIVESGSAHFIAYGRFENRPLRPDNL